jgi:adenine-specific DNA-methyltransferase
LKEPIEKRYSTIIGNPPYIRTKHGNTYIDFIEKCFGLLDQTGELIFIVPSDFFKLTSSKKLLHKMNIFGSFTHVFHPHNEKLFENANIDIIIFRYSLNTISKTLYNDELIDLFHSGTFFSQYFNIYVGMVSGKESVYKNEELGNISLLNGLGDINKYIYTTKLKPEDSFYNYLNIHKQDLISRKIRSFNESNWFEWGAPRNMKVMESQFGKECIYMSTITRNKIVAFKSTVMYFGGSLIMMLPKKKMDLNVIVNYLNSDLFKKRNTFSGRFKMGHRQLSECEFPEHFS